MATPWTRVQAPTPATSTGTGSVGLAWSQATQPGSLLVALVAYNTTTGTPPAINAPAGWATDGPKNLLASACGAQIFYIKNSASRSGTETFSLASSARDMFLALFEYSGNLQTTLGVNTSSAAASATAVPTTGTTAGATANKHSLIISIIANKNNASQSLAAGTPTGTFAAAGNATSGNATANARVTAYVYEDLGTATGTAEAHATLSTSQPYAAAIAEFTYDDTLVGSATSTATVAGKSSADVLRGLAASTAVAIAKPSADQLRASALGGAVARAKNWIDGALHGTRAYGAATGRAHPNGGLGISTRNILRSKVRGAAGGAAKLLGGLRGHAHGSASPRGRVHFTLDVLHGRSAGAAQLTQLQMTGDDACGWGVVSWGIPDWGEPGCGESGILPQLLLFEVVLTSDSTVDVREAEAGTTVYARIVFDMPAGIGTTVLLASDSPYVNVPASTSVTPGVTEVVIPFTLDAITFPVDTKITADLVLV